MHILLYPSFVLFLFGVGFVLYITFILFIFKGFVCFKPLSIFIQCTFHGHYHNVAKQSIYVGSFLSKMLNENSRSIYDALLFINFIK